MNGGKINAGKPDSSMLPGPDGLKLRKRKALPALLVAAEEAEATTGEARCEGAHSTMEQRAFNPTKLIIFLGS